MNSKDLLKSIIYEANSYNNFEDLEKLVEKGVGLSNLPIQPLYISLQNASYDQIANILPRLSKQQRQCFLDLDLWVKDSLDVDGFEHWVEIYAKCSDDDIIREFTNSEEFILYLRSRVNLYTFDVEDPQYPDHDNYFLTDDNLILVEYFDDYACAQELKYLLRHFYDQHGVENAYSLLFKIINDSFHVLEEEQYQHKKERLRDYGFVDYYEALEKTHPFSNEKSIINFIKNKDFISVNVSSTHRNQSLHSSAVVSFDKDTEIIISELIKVNDESKLNFLHFNFVRLINSTITLKNALKGGRIELTKIGEYTKSVIELGIEFIRSLDLTALDKSVFERFDFFDVYKIGHSLIHLNKNRLKKSLAKTPFEKDDFEYFLGAWWCSFVENTFSEVPKVKSFGVGRHIQSVNNIKTWDFWKKETETLVSFLPFVTKFFESFNDLKKGNKLNDQFYLNYTTDNIDVESILISSFVNFCINPGVENKMGLTLLEFKNFIKSYFTKTSEEYNLKKFEDLSSDLKAFLKSFGLDLVPNSEFYLYGILFEHLSGYEYDTLEDEDFSHVGGPILLNVLSEH